MIGKRIYVFIIVMLFQIGMIITVSAQNCSIRTIVNADKPSEAQSDSVFYGRDCAVSLKRFQKSLILRRQSKDVIGEAWDLTQIGDIYYDLKDEQKALEYYNQALPLFRQLNNEWGKWEILGVMAYISRRQQNYTDALKYLEEALVVYDSAPNGSGKVNVSLTFKSIAEIYLETGREAKAFEFFDKSLKAARENNIKWSEAETLTLMGKVYETKGKKTEALKSYRDALSLYVEDNREFPGAMFDGQKVVSQERYTGEMKTLRESIERLQKLTY